MRKLGESTLVSLDGVIESPERWAMFDDEATQQSMQALDDYDAFVMGRVTYESLVRHGCQFLQPTCPSKNFERDVSGVASWMACESRCVRCCLPRRLARATVLRRRAIVRVSWAIEPRTVEAECEDA